MGTGAETVGKKVSHKPVSLVPSYNTVRIILALSQ